MLNDLQYKQLLSPLNSSRVSKRSQSGRSLSYVEAWDIKRTLIRIFGFGGWSWDVVDADLAFEHKTPSSKGGENWQVGYKVRGKLSIPALCATYTEAAVGFASLPDRGEAHDMAVKTAESDALKRAAICLGTQFGLSLYQNGATGDVVQRTLDRDESLHRVVIDEARTVRDAVGEPAAPVVTYDDPPVAPEDAPESPEAPVEAETAPEPPTAPTEASEAAQEWIGKLADAVKRGSIPAVLEIKTQITAAKQGRLMYQGRTLAKWCDEAVIKAGKGVVSEVTDEEVSA